MVTPRRARLAAAVFSCAVALSCTPTAAHGATPSASAQPPGCSGTKTPAGSRPLPTGISSRAWLIADLDTGAVLGECHEHDRNPPASTLKLLTVLTVLPHLDPHQVVTITPEDNAFEPGSSAVGIVAGGKYTVQTLLEGLLLVSGNDTARALARLAGGTGGMAATITEMNANARALGALDTTAMTPHGLDAPSQLTSAYDLALIARACFARPDFRALDATRTAELPPQTVTLPNGRVKSYGGFQIQNDNKLLRNYPGAIGGKTGFTDLARHTYVGAAERHGRRLVVTLMDGEQHPVRMWQQGAALLDWGFALDQGARVDDLHGGHLGSGQLSAGHVPPASRPGASTAPAATHDLAAPHSTPPTRLTALDYGAVGGTAAALAVAAWCARARVNRRRLRSAGGGRNR